MTIRIAMWSGPRNLSTAMMRSWENRTDTAVLDEPLSFKTGEGDDGIVRQTCCDVEPQLGEHRWGQLGRLVVC